MKKIEILISSLLGVILSYNVLESIEFILQTTSIIPIFFSQLVMIIMPVLLIINIIYIILTKISVKSILNMFVLYYSFVITLGMGFYTFADNGAISLQYILTIALLVLIIISNIYIINSKKLTFSIINLFKIKNNYKNKR